MTSALRTPPIRAGACSPTGRSVRTGSSSPTGYRDAPPAVELRPGARPGAGGAAVPALGRGRGARLRSPLGERPVPCVRARRHGRPGAPRRGRADPLPPLRRGRAGRGPGAGRGPVAARLRVDRRRLAGLPPAALLAAAARRVECRLEAVDSNGLLPLAAAGRDFPSAHVFRRFLQARLAACLTRPPLADPSPPPGCRGSRACRRRSSGAGAADEALLAAAPAALAALPIDHEVAPVPALPGGARAGERALDEFVERRLPRYAEGRSHPDAEASSGLSPYLHFGHLSAHAILARVGAREGWSRSPPRLGRRRARGVVGNERVGRGVPRPAGHLARARLPRRRAAAGRLRPLRGAAGLGARDAREARGRRASRALRHDRLEQGDTGDELWNAAQRQLRGEGRIHNYLRMLWGKRVLEWTPTPREALPRCSALKRPLGSRRARPELRERHRLVPRPVRPALGAGAPGLRHGALHVERQHAAQAAPDRLPAPLVGQPEPT